MGNLSLLRFGRLCFIAHLPARGSHDTYVRRQEKTSLRTDSLFVDNLAIRGRVV